MNDEKYLFVSDSAEKKRTARGAFNKHTHGGRVRMPSDYLTRKERKKMSGECKSYRLNEPMKWADFKKMPDDIKITYIKMLREKFGVTDKTIFEMLGVSQKSGSAMVTRLGIGVGRGHASMTENLSAWEKWCAGIKEPIEKDCEAVAEERKPIEVIYEEEKKIYPHRGRMALRGTPEEIGRTIAKFLGSAICEVDVSWSVVNDA